ncbi:MAG: UDP-2,4-diacetamido-2,4,6-trideoxy-beta-L-altropyranose hydrolase [Cyanobacteria bacterium SZAS LIN-3]|nr:UDP-2,4-diacetamido-2,4,6-trideoxy-beta-L-altropyranose hydrolase [Cyanobacteria bacterium SZAS LIN-3]
MTRKLTQFLIRVDGSETIGTGHIMRCLALAGELKRQGHGVSFLTALCPDALKKRLVAEGHRILPMPPSIEPGSPVDARFTVAAAGERLATIVVMDGYHFDGKYQHFIKDARLKSLYIDDLAHCEYYCSDYVLNQNPSARSTLYPDTAPQTQLLLGTKYALIRSEFHTYRQNNAPTESVPQARNILLTMGGGDKDNVSGRVMEALNRAPASMNLQITVLVGASNQHAEALQRSAEEFNSAGSHRFEIQVNPGNIPELIGKSDLVVTAGGTTVWEAAYLGRPMAVIITADNQKAGMEACLQQEAISLLGEQDLSGETIAQHLLDLIQDQGKRESLARQAATMVDGKGAGRLVQALTA